MLYRYYWQHFIASFSVSFHTPVMLHIHHLPRIALLAFQGQIRLKQKNHSLLLRAVFLFTLMCSLRGAVSCLRTNYYIYNTFYRGSNSLDFYSKFVTLIYPQLARKPFLYSYGVNDYYQLAFNSYMCPEEYFLGLARAAKIFRGSFALNFFFSPSKCLDCYTQRNFFRMLNFPLQHHV